MAEATSNHFVAQLGEATSEVEARLRQWAASCVEHCFVRDEISRASIYFARAESRTVRQMQSLLRTLTSRWGLPMGKPEAGWLQPLTAEEFRAAVADAALCDTPATTPAARTSAPHACVPTAAPPAAPIGDSALGAPYNGMRTVLQLSPGFDAIGRELLAQLRAQVAC